MTESALIIDIKVIPQSQDNRFVEFKNGILKIKIKGTPVKGKVNENLINFLAETFNISKSQIQMISGLTSPRKKIKILGLKESFPEICSRLHIPGGNDFF